MIIDINDDPQNQIRTPAGDKLLNTPPATGFLSRLPVAAVAPVASAV